MPHNSLASGSRVYQLQVAFWYEEGSTAATSSTKASQLIVISALDFSSRFSQESLYMQ